MSKSTIGAIALAALSALLALTACGGDQVRVGTTPQLAVQQDAAPQKAGWPAGLPSDGVQPWETVGADGYVQPTTKSSSSITANAEFVNGVDVFTQGGSTANTDGVLMIDSGNAGSGDTSWAIYRLVMGGNTPGALGVDINLRNRSDGSPSAYYLGLANYAKGLWEWHGPYTDGQARLELSGNMLSGLGNAFVAVVAYDGADIDVVGLGIDPKDAGDFSAPPKPAAPSVTPVDGGLLLEWVPVVAGDLAGYNIYYSASSFVDQSSPGVKMVDFVEGNTRHILSGLTNKTYVRISAVDISGNESSLSDIASGTPLAGTAGNVEFTVDKAVGLIGDSFTVTASGADSYDFDLDGDGTFELTGVSSGTQMFNASSAGIIRPAVRGTSGTSIALGAVSLVVSGNSRPVAHLTADPTEGAAPIAVAFSSEGEDFDGTVEEYAWDFDGDGVYDTTSALPTLPGPHVYSTPGVYNAKLKVTDDSGAYDIDTVSIFVREAIGFHQYFIDTDSDLEGYLAAAMVDGHPAVVYFDTAHNHLQFCRALDSQGHNWGAPLDIATATGAGNLTALAVIAGKPAVAWYNTFNGNIEYLIADDADGTSWTLTPVQVTTGSTSASQELALAEVASNPAVCWHEFSSNNLMYCRASSGAGTGATAADWGDAPAVIDNSHQVGGPPELAVVDGNPAVAYMQTNHIKFKRAVNSTGALVGDWPATAIDCTPGLVPSFRCGLAVVNGNPAIVFPEGTLQTLAYMRALDPDGNTWPAGPVAVNGSMGTPLTYVDIKIIRGKPAIAFQFNVPEPSVWYTRAADANGSAWSVPTPVVIDGATNPGDCTTLLDNQGEPDIAYLMTGWHFIGFSTPEYQ